MSKQLEVLVTGATGKQGGAVAALLLQKGHKVRALTRKVDLAAAKALGQKGVALVSGSLDDRASIDRALQGVDGVFSMSTPFEAGIEAETRQGVTVSDAAKAAGVHLVYTSVGSADKATGIPHFDSKYAVEKHITTIGAAATIIAPVYFMENAIAFGRDQLKEGVYATPLAPTIKLAQIALSNIAACAVAAFENRALHIGKRYDIGGDDVSGNQAIETLTRVTGKKFKYFQVPMDMIRQRMGDDGVKMYEWFERVGYTIDHQALKKAFPEVRWHSFEAWAKEQDWKSIFG